MTHSQCFAAVTDSALCSWSPSMCRWVQAHNIKGNAVCLPRQLQERRSVNTHWAKTRKSITKSTAPHYGARCSEAKRQEQDHVTGTGTSASCVDQRARCGWSPRAATHQTWRRSRRSAPWPPPPSAPPHTRAATSSWTGPGQRFQCAAPPGTRGCSCLRPTCKSAGRGQGKHISKRGGGRGRGWGGGGAAAQLNAHQAHKRCAPKCSPHKARYSPHPLVTHRCGNRGGRSGGCPTPACHRTWTTSRCSAQPPETRSPAHRKDMQSPWQQEPWQQTHAPHNTVCTLSHAGTSNASPPENSSLENP
jgi:hypothetical protein